MQEGQRAARIEAFKAAEVERAQASKLAAKRALAGAADDLATSEETLRELAASLAEVERDEGNSAQEVAACEAAVAEVDSLAQSAREAELRARRAREARGAALDGARGATARATAARTDAERAAAAAKEAATEAAELIGEAERLSAEARDAEQQAVASARALGAPGSTFADEMSALVGDEIDLTDLERPAGEGRNGDAAGSPDLSSEIS